MKRRISTSFILVRCVWRFYPTDVIVYKCFNVKATSIRYFGFVIIENVRTRTFHKGNIDFYRGKHTIRYMYVHFNYNHLCIDSVSRYILGIGNSRSKINFCKEIQSRFGCKITCTYTLVGLSNANVLSHPSTITLS